MENSSNKYLKEKIPWEERRRLGTIKAFFINLKEIILNPKLYFCKISNKNDCGGVIIYFLILMIFSGVFDYIWENILDISILIGFKEMDSKAPIIKLKFLYFIFQQLIKLFEFTIISIFKNLFLFFLNFKKKYDLIINIKILMYSYSAEIFSIIPLFGKIAADIYFYILIVIGIKVIHNKSLIISIMIVFLSFLILHLIYGFSAFALSFFQSFY